VLYRIESRLIVPLCVPFKTVTPLRLPTTSSVVGGLMVYVSP
jgi:hypothetical protein